MAKKTVRLNSGGKLRRHRPYTGYGERIAALGTQAEIGAAMGVAQQSVSKKLRGGSATTFSELTKLAAHYDLPLTYFFENGPCDPDLSSVEEHIRTEPGPLRELAVSVCSLSPTDRALLLDIAELLAR